MRAIGCLPAAVQATRLDNDLFGDCTRMKAGELFFSWLPVDFFPSLPGLNIPLSQKKPK